MNPETYPHTSTQLIVDRGAKASQWRKGCLLSRWCWSQWTPMGIKMNYTLNLTSYTKINSKWKMELKSSGPRVGRVLRLDTKKGTIGKLDLIKFKNLCSAKESIRRVKRWAKHGRRYLQATYLSAKGLLSRIYKELLKPNNRKANNLIRTWAKVMKRRFIQKKVFRWQ